MKFEEKENFLENTLNIPSKCRIRNLIEINDESREIYKANNQITFENLMIRSNFWDFCDAYILASGTITITVARADDAVKQLHVRNKEVKFKNCPRFPEHIRNINNTQMDKGKDM